MRVLLVEDNRTLAEWLAKTLQQDRFMVECAYDGEDALYRLGQNSYDLVILDLDIPKIDGRSVLRRVRQRENAVPVLILTASTGLQSRISGLDEGADDYLGKPFEVAELLARMRVLLRRSTQKSNPVWNCGDLVYNSNTRQFQLEQRPLNVTPKEHAVLEALMMRHGQTVSKQALCESLYTVDEEASPDAIEIYVHRLRKKLEGSSAAIVTLRGLGYLLQRKGD